MFSPWLSEAEKPGPHGTTNLTRATVQRSACTPAGTRRPMSQRSTAVTRTSTVPFWSAVQTEEPSAAVASSSWRKKKWVIGALLLAFQLLLDLLQILLGQRLVLDELEHELVGAAVEDRADELAQPLAARRALGERRPVDVGLAALVDL